jgi:hypothetical protein
MKKLLLTVIACSLIFTAHAAPTPVSPAVTSSGDGLIATWVDNYHNPHNITLLPHSLTEADRIWGMWFYPRLVQVTPFINHTDSIPTHTSGWLLQPAGFAADGDFVLRYTGFLNVVTGGTYTFRAFTDDGFGFKLGGETIMSYVTDRTASDSVATINLASGLYELDFLVWEEGGLFVSELDWITPGNTTYSLVPTSALFTYAPPAPPPNDVPEPGMLALFGTALAAPGFKRRRSHCST